MSLRRLGQELEVEFKFSACIIIEYIVHIVVIQSALKKTAPVIQFLEVVVFIHVLKY